MDIGSFEIGDMITSPSGFVYEVLRFKYADTQKKREIVASICKNINTGEEAPITWDKGRNFNRFEIATPEKIIKFKNKF